MPRSAAAWARINDPIIATFRAHGGTVPGRRHLLLLGTVGARSGEPRITPLRWTRDGDRLVVIASDEGSPTHPQWYHNLVADPRVLVELGTESFAALASTAHEPERTRLFEQHVAVMPFFDGYRRKAAPRRIPVVVLERLPGRPGG